MTLKKMFYKILKSLNKLIVFTRFQIEYYPSGQYTQRTITDFLRHLKPLSQSKELIRIGSDSDGGYLIPNDLEGVRFCYSPGVSDNSDFEAQLSNNGIQCYLADYSVDAPNINKNLLHFTKKFISNKEDYRSIRLETWIQDNLSDNEMILQMDIEGSEYKVILDTPLEILTKFRILVIEFHGFGKLPLQHSFDLISTTFYKLLLEFRIVHVHANNCAKPIRLGKNEIPQTLEFTFLRKDRFIPSDKKNLLPHPLDRRNMPNKKDVDLPSMLL